MTKRQEFVQYPMEISRAAWFEAAHYLDKCDDGRGYHQMHGHSFKMEITLRGVPAKDTGWVEDLAKLGEALEGIRAVLDHACLNDIAGLETPSLEHICAWVAAKLTPDFSNLVKVRVSRPSLSESCLLRL